MYGLLNELVIPALARQEEVMQELGLQCLGLICALDQNLAQSNMELFLTCIFADQASDQLHQLSLKVRLASKSQFLNIIQASLTPTAVLSSLSIDRV